MVKLACAGPRRPTTETRRTGWPARAAAKSTWRGVVGGPTLRLFLSLSLSLSLTLSSNRSLVHAITCAQRGRSLVPMGGGSPQRRASSRQWLETPQPRPRARSLAGPLGLRFWRARGRNRGPRCPERQREQRKRIRRRKAKKCEGGNVRGWQLERRARRGSASSPPRRPSPPTHLPAAVLSRAKRDKVPNRPQDGTLNCPFSLSLATPAHKEQRRARDQTPPPPPPPPPPPTRSE